MGRPALKRGFVVVAMLMALVFVGAAAPSPPAAPADEATAYQLDATHDGYMANAGLAAPLTQAWSIALPGASYPLIADGMVFVTSANNHTLYALNQATGATIWSHPIGGTGGLAYDRGRVFAVNNSGLLTAFDAAIGSIAWSEKLPGQWSFTSPPTAVNGIVYAGGAGDAGTVYAVRESDGVLLWTQPVKDGDASSPAVTDQGVYVSYPCQAYDFDPQLGTLLWHDTSGCEGGGGDTPVVASGYVFVRDGGGLGNVLLSPSTGAVQGSFNAGAGYAYSMPAVANDVVFTVNGQPQNTMLSAVDGAGLGSTDWTFAGDGGLDTAPIVVGGLVFVGSSAGNLYALDAATGATSWSTNVGSSISGNLAAANGTLIVSAGNNVVAYRTAGTITDAPSNQAPPTVDGSDDLNEVKATDVGIWSGLPSAYSYQWELCDGVGANCADIAGATGPTYVPAAEAYGMTLRVRVVATNGVGSSGPVESAATTVLGLATAAPTFSTSPAVSGTPAVGQQLSTTNGTWTSSATSYAYQWQRCDDTGANCVDIAGATGSEYTPVEDDVGSELRSEVLASNAIGPAPSGYAPSAATSVVVEIGAPALLTSPVDEATGYHLDVTHDGYMPDAGLSGQLTQAWSVNLGNYVSYPLIAQGMVFAAGLSVVNGKSVDTLYALNQATGSVVWSKPTGTQPNTEVGLAYDRGRVFFADQASGLSAFDAATGAVAWSVQIPFDSLQSPPTAASGIVYTSGSSVYAIRESDGAILWKQQVDGGNNSAPAVTAQGVYVSYDCPQVYDFDPQLGTLLWHDGPVCEGGGGETPVVADGHVFVRDSVRGNVILSASAGAVQGSFNATQAPALANGVAFMFGDSTLSAIHADGFGNFAWTFSGDGNLSTAPIVVGNVVFEGSGGSGGHLYALDKATGATLWSTPSAAPSDLAAANGTLVVAAGPGGTGLSDRLVAYRNGGTITDPPSNESPPTVEGPADLSGLEAVDVGIWSGLPNAYAYQWELCDGAGANCTDIAGATGASYLSPAEDVGVGDTLRVRVTATNGIGSSAPVESAPSVSSPLLVVGQHALRRQGRFLTGTPGVGQQLATTNGIWTNDPTSYVYKWQRCDNVGLHCADIAGATSPQYTPVSADGGHELRSEVRGRNGIGNAATYAPSAPTSPVDGSGRPHVLGSPVVSGKARVGSQLSTTTGSWTYAPTSYKYQWQRCDTNGSQCDIIPYATRSRYTLVAADGGHEIRAEVLASNAAGAATDGYAQSAPTRVVPHKPTLIKAPKLSGVAKIGKSLSVTTGTWKYSPKSYAYQWFRCNGHGTSCKKIARATRSSYRLTPADTGHKLTARVTASNAAGSTTAKTSNKSATVKK